MMALDDFQALLRRVEQANRLNAEAEGAYQELLKRLKEDFGCKTTEEAETLLEELNRKFKKITNLYIPRKKEIEEELDKLEGKS